MTFLKIAKKVKLRFENTSISFLNLNDYLAGVGKNTKSISIVFVDSYFKMR